MSLGGWSETKDAQSEVSTLAKWMQDVVQSETNRTFDEFSAVEYRSQVVSGTNYLIKVLVGPNDEYVHLQVFVSLLLRNKMEIGYEGVQTGHRKEDPLVPFRPFAKSEDAS